MTFAYCNLTKSCISVPTSSFSLKQNVQRHQRNHIITDINDPSIFITMMPPTSKANLTTHDHPIDITLQSPTSTIEVNSPFISDPIIDITCTHHPYLLDLISVISPPDEPITQYTSPNEPITDITTISSPSSYMTTPTFDPYNSHPNADSVTHHFINPSPSLPSSFLIESIRQAVVANHKHIKSLPHNNNYSYYDNATSTNVTNNLSLLYQVTILPHPIPLGGVGGLCNLTHVGRLYHLPVTLNLNICYYSVHLPATLFSLGLLQRCGGHYCPDPHRPRTHVRVSSSLLLPPIDIPMLSTSNLLPINFDSLAAAARRSPHLYHTPPQSSFLQSILTPNQSLFQVPTPPTHPPLATHGVHPTVPTITTTPLPTSTINDIMPTLLPFIPDPTVPHTPEQRRRCDAVDNLHTALFHPSDTSLSTSISFGKCPGPLPLTATDVTRNRLIRGPCIHCIAGKYRHSPQPLSLTSPASSVGAVLSFDPQILPVPATGGFTQVYIFVDEFSGYIHVEGSLSKQTNHSFDAVRNVITSVFNAHQHPVLQLHGDCESINLSLAQPLGAIGCTLVSSLPGDHAHRVERYWQTLITVCIAVLESLSYYLPKKFLLQLLQAGSVARNSLVSPRSSPSTPNELVRGILIPPHLFPFGSCCMVRTHDDKRISNAIKYNTSPKFESKMEVGVCLGPCLLTGHYKFLLANGFIVPRAPTTPFVSTFVPFNWKQKTYFPTSPTPPYLDPPSDPRPPVPPTPPTNLPLHTHPSLHNKAVQLPSLPPSTALRLLSPTLIPSLPPSVLSTIRSTPPLQPPTTVSELPQQQVLANSIDNVTEQPTPLHPAPHNSLTIPTHLDPLVTQPTPTYPQSPSSSLHQSVPENNHQHHQQKPNPVPPTITRAVTRSQSRLSSLLTSFLSVASPTPLPIVPPVPQPKNCILKKQSLIKAATTTHRLHFLASNHTANNNPTDLIPIPLPPSRPEMPIEKAYRTLDNSKVTASIDKEMKKVHVDYRTLIPLLRKNIQEKSLYLRSQCFVKQKLLGDVSTRLAIDGSRQPPDSYNSTFAGTSDTERFLCLLSAFVADAAIRLRSPLLQIFSFDVTGAFLFCKLLRSDTNGYQFYTTLPKDLPGPEAGALREIVGGQYGIKQSNNLFDNDICGELERNGYHSEELSPHIFGKRCPIDPSDSIAVNLHVDDGAVVSTSAFLSVEFKSILSAKYPNMKWQDEMKHYCGIDVHRLPDLSVHLDMRTHILAFLTKNGMDPIPGALTPGLADFFDPPTDLTPFDPTIYQSVQGQLIFYCLIRIDIKMFVHHLSSANHNPTQSHRDKQIHVMRYLKSYPSVGPTFSSDPKSYPNGVQLEIDCDNSHATQPNSRDQSGILYRIGTTNACFASFASAEPGVSLSPQEGEYGTMCRAAKNAVFWRQLLEGFGFPQDLPTPIFEDNLPAINLVSAPEITKNSRHLLLKHHYVRWLNASGIIKPVHRDTNIMLADFLTKVFPPRKFHFFKDKIFNLISNSVSSFFSPFRSMFYK